MMNVIRFRGGNREEWEYNGTISEALHSAGIVRVKKQDEMFSLSESCDDYFTVFLTREQYTEWIKELTKLADE